MRSLGRSTLFGDELVLDLQLNEGAGAFCFDRSINKFFGELTHDVGATDPSWVISTIGSQTVMTLDFDETNEEFVDFGAIIAPWDRFSVTGAITIEALIYCDAVHSPNFQMIFAGDIEHIGAAGAAFPQLCIEENGYFEFLPCRDYPAAGGCVTGAVDLAAGWHHIVAHYSDSDDIAGVEVDGGDTDSATGTMTTTTALYDPTGEKVMIGARYDSNGADHQHFLDGHVAYVRAWARRLIVQERLTLFKMIQSRYGL